jgi:hypothetical protein
VSSYTSELSLKPPAIRTLPEASIVAVWMARGYAIGPVEANVPEPAS